MSYTGIRDDNADALSRRSYETEYRHCSKDEEKEGLVDVRLLQVLPKHD